MGEIIILPLNCGVSYYEYNPKKDESYTDSFYILVKKVTKRAILIERGDPWEEGPIHRCWLPKRFIKRVFKKDTKDGECWFMEFRYKDYCEYREWLADNKKSIAGLCGCGFLSVDGYETEKGVVYPIYDIKPFEEIEEKEPEIKEEDWDLPVPLYVSKKEKPGPVKELEKLLTEFGIKG